MRLQRLTGLEQDKIVGEYREVMAQIADLLDILARPERITAIIVDELAPIKQRIRRRAPLEDRAERHRTEHRRPDHAAGNGRDHVARGLREVAAAVRISRAKARWARQAGHGR